MDICTDCLVSSTVCVLKRTNWEDLPFTRVPQIVYQCSGLLLWEEKCFAHTKVHLSVHSMIPRVGMRQAFSCTLGYTCVCARRIILAPMKYIAVSAQGSCVWCISCQCFSSLIILFAVEEFYLCNQSVWLGQYSVWVNTNSAVPQLILCAVWQVYFLFTPLHV